MPKLLDNATAVGYSEIWRTEGGSYMYDVRYNVGTGTTTLKRSVTGDDVRPVGTGDFAVYVTSLTNNESFATGVNLPAGYYAVELIDITGSIIDVDVELAPIEEQGEFHIISTGLYERFGTSGVAPTNNFNATVNYGGQVIQSQRHQ